MSSPPPRPPPPPEVLSLQATAQSWAPTTDKTPPPPPPKQGGGNIVQHGGPLAPALPNPSSTGTAITHPSQALPESQRVPAPPIIEDGWLPEVLREQTKPDLEALLAEPALLDAILRASGTAHPSLRASDAVILAHLAQNQALANHVAGEAQGVEQQRADVSSRLLQLRALERQWHLKQGQMDDALAPFSPKALHARLVAGIGEQSGILAAMEESFLEDDGKAGDREIGEFVKRWRDGQKILGLRLERRRRFEEGRVGGWR